MNKKDDIYIEILPPGKININFAELWTYRELLFFFTWRDVKVKYKQTTLGFLWAVLQPAIMMVIFTLLFSKISGDFKTSTPYPIFVYTGLMLWNIFSSGLQNAGSSMVSNANIIKKIYFPRLIIPISAILVSVFDYLMTLIIFVVLILYYKVDINWIRLFTFYPLAVLITIIYTFGAGSFLAALNVKYRDFRYVIPFLIQVLMFVSPVIYPLTIVDNQFMKYFLYINPMSASVILARSIFSTEPVDYNIVLVGIAVSLILLFVGIFYFRKTEAYFADIA